MEYGHWELGDQPPTGYVAVPAAWGEPVTIGAEADRVDDTPEDPYADYGGSELGIQQDADATEDPVADGEDRGGADVPPETPLLVTTAEGEPNRGEALRHVLAHASTSAERIHDRLRGLVIDNAETLELSTYLDEEGDYAMALDEAVDYLATAKELEPGQRIRNVAVTDELVEAQAGYGDMLETAGLQFWYRNDRELALEIADPEPIPKRSNSYKRQALPKQSGKNSISRPA